MAKCTNCRQKDIELLTRWERIKDWLFYRLFPKDIADLSQNKYMQGFGDGYRTGTDGERAHVRDMVKKLYNIDI